MMDVNVTFKPECGFVASIPGRRVPIIALSLSHLKTRIALMNAHYRVRLDIAAQSEVNRRKVKV
jgi:hypothetical protein